MQTMHIAANATLVYCCLNGTICLKYIHNIIEFVEQVSIKLIFVFIRIDDEEGGFSSGKEGSGEIEEETPIPVTHATRSDDGHPSK